MAPAAVVFIVMVTHYCKAKPIRRRRLQAAPSWVSSQCYGSVAAAVKGSRARRASRCVICTGVFRCRCCIIVVIASFVHKSRRSALESASCDGLETGRCWRVDSSEGFSLTRSSWRPERLPLPCDDPSVLGSALGASITQASANQGTRISIQDQDAEASTPSVPGWIPLTENALFLELCLYLCLHLYLAPPSLLPNIPTFPAPGVSLTNNNSTGARCVTQFPYRRSQPAKKQYPGHRTLARTRVVASEQTQ